MRSYRVSEIAAKIGGQMEGSADPSISGVAGIREAQPGQITFLAHPRYASYVATTRADALIVGFDHVAEQAKGPVLIRVTDPYVGFLQTLRLYGAERPKPVPGTHPSAVIHPTARLGDGVSIGAHVVIEAGAKIGSRVILMPGVFVGSDSEIGDDSCLYPNVVVREASRLGQRVIVHAGAVIGADGFGYVKAGGVHLKVPQLGTVQIARERVWSLYPNPRFPVWDGSRDAAAWIGEPTGRGAGSAGPQAARWTVLDGSYIQRGAHGGAHRSQETVSLRVPLKEIESFIATRRAKGDAIDVRLLMLLGPGILGRT